MFHAPHCFPGGCDKTGEQLPLTGLYSFGRAEFAVENPLENGRDTPVKSIILLPWRRMALPTGHPVAYVLELKN